MNTLSGKQCLELCMDSVAHAEALHKIGCLTV